MFGCSAQLFLQVYNRPFQNDRLDILDCTALVALSLYMFAGILFSFDHAVGEDSTRLVFAYRDELMVLTIAMILSMVVVILVMFALDIRDRRDQLAVRKMMLTTWQQEDGQAALKKQRKNCLSRLDRLVTTMQALRRVLRTSKIAQQMDPDNLKSW